MGGDVRRGYWLAGSLCLVASACAGQPAVTVTVPAERSLAASQSMQDEHPDLMIEIVLAPTPGPETTSTPAGAARGSAKSESAAALQITQPASTPAAPAPTTTPRVAAATPRPASTAPPSTVTPAPTSVPGCRLGAALGDGDGMVRAAQVPPALFYGGGLCAGERVEAVIAGKSCGTSTVDAAGQWSISIRTTAACAPSENAAVTFTVNGSAAAVSPSAVWKSGGLPPNVAAGYALTR